MDKRVVTYQECYSCKLLSMHKDTLFELSTKLPLAKEILFYLYETLVAWTLEDPEVLPSRDVVS